MPLPLLPLFSDDMIVINQYIAVQEKDDTVFWYHGALPVFRHHVRDQSSFRLICCQLINIGTATSAEISRALKINHEKLSRWARLERDSQDRQVPSISVKSSKKKPMY
jgi:hypothetical protein